MKKTYQPGECGSISVTYTFGDDIGWNQKTITVYTDDTAAPKCSLTIKAYIPLFLDVRPGFLYWGGGGLRKSRTVHVKVANDSPIKLVRAYDPKGLFMVDTRVIKPGREYELTVTPKPGAGNLESYLILQTDTPRDKPRSFELYAHAGR